MCVCLRDFCMMRLVCLCGCAKSFTGFLPFLRIWTILFPLPDYFICLSPLSLSLPSSPLSSIPPPPITAVIVCLGTNASAHTPKTFNPFPSFLPSLSPPTLPLCWWRGRQGGGGDIRGTAGEGGGGSDIRGPAGTSGVVGPRELELSVNCCISCLTCTASVSVPVSVSSLAF